jgi:large subunit ribosomal protein L29
MKDAQIGEALGKMRARLFELRQQAATQKVEDISEFGKVRKDIARLLTERSARRKATAKA